jgi:hypothetical protein
MAVFISKTTTNIGALNSFRMLLAHYLVDDFVYLRNICTHSLYFIVCLVIAAIIALNSISENIKFIAEILVNPVLIVG